MRLRPHHVLDIVSDIGKGVRFEPHPYGHSLHTVAEAILASTDIKAEWVVGSDAICQGCKHLRPNGSCGDLMGPVDHRRSKQAYNDAHDGRLLGFLGFPAGTRMSVREYLVRVLEKMPEIAKVCSHPGESPAERLAGLEKGLAKLGIGLASKHPA